MLLRLVNTLVTVWPIGIFSVKYANPENWFATESVVSTTPPLLVSNTLLSNTASSNNCLVSSNVTK